MKRHIFIFLLGLLLCNTVYSQTSENKVTPFLKIGYGYFNDELMIDGNILSGEVGIKLKTNYIFSLKMNFADALNDIAFYSDFPEIVEWNLIYTYKWATLNMGYEFIAKNRHHTFIPMMGLFYSTEQVTYPKITDEGVFEFKKENRPKIGIDLTLQYLFNFKNGISVGLNASGNLAFQYGPVYYTITPVISFKLD